MKTPEEIADFMIEDWALEGGELSPTEMRKLIAQGIRDGGKIPSFGIKRQWGKLILADKNSIASPLIYLINKGDRTLLRNLFWRFYWRENLI